MLKLHKVKVNAAAYTLGCAGWGLFVCVLAMLAAGIVEFARLEYFRRGRVLPEKFHSSQIVDLSVFWQIPQYLLVGLSEVLPSYSAQPSLNGDCCNPITRFVVNLRRA